MNPEYNFYPVTDTPQKESPYGMGLDSIPAYNNPVASPDPTNIVDAPNGTIMKNGQLQSPNYAVGVSGWIIRSDGSVEFGSGVFRGDITGASGTFSGSIQATSIDIPDTTTENSFHVDSSGNAWWGATTLGAANAYVLNTGVAKFAVTNTEIPQITAAFTANESITALNSVRAAISEVSYRNVSTTASDTPIYGAGGANAMSAFKFTIGSVSAVSKATIKLKKFNTPSGYNVKVSVVADSGGTPGGAVQQTAALLDVASLTTSYVAYDFNFTLMTLAAGDYWILVERDSGRDTLRYFQLGNDGNSTAGNMTSNNDSGGTWAQDAQFDGVVVYNEGTAGGIRIAKAASTFQAKAMGFALSSGAAAASIVCALEGKLSGLSSLTVGATYYLKDDGTLGTSAGTVSVKMGIAISTTELLLKIPAQ